MGQKDEAYLINLAEFESVETHWIALYVNAENVTWFHFMLLISC